MATRVQVVLSEEERDRFKGQARREGLSLSAWLRLAGRERLEAAGARLRFDTPEALDDFFRECDARETGREPDWEEHLRVMTASRGSGAGDA